MLGDDSVYVERHKLKANIKYGEGNALIAVRNGVQLRPDYLHFWKQLDANGEVDKEVYTELDLGTKIGSGRKPITRKRTARCAIRLSILQAFVEAGGRLLSLKQLQESWQSHIAKFKDIYPIELDRTLNINDVAALCGIPAPSVKKGLHPSPPLEVASYGEALHAEQARKYKKPRSVSKVEAMEIEKIESVYADNPTERDALVSIRVGQSSFRDALLRKWKTCSVTGISNPVLLIASHIQPWRECQVQQKLDPENGLLLAAHLDKLFDSGLITFDRDGSIMVSSELSEVDRHLMNITENMFLRETLSDDAQAYMEFHRDRIFKGLQD